MKMQRMAISVVTLLAAMMMTDHLLAAEAGSVLFARGEVTAERAPPQPLAKGDAVLDDDTVATGEASRAQLLMLDGAKVAIRPSSQFRIDEYVFGGETDADGNVISTSGDRSVATLLKGGFRTITGAIGNDEEEAYEVRTPVGVLGIRGTDYSAVFCNGDCDWVPGFDPDAPVEDGLYIGVTDGIVFFRNASGDIELQTGEYAFIPLTDQTPTRLTAPPQVLLDDNDLAFDADAPVAGRPDADDDQSMGFDSVLGTRRAPDVPDSSAAPAVPDDLPDDATQAPATTIDAIDIDGEPVDLTPGIQPSPDGNRTIGYATGPLGRADTIFSDTLDNGATEFTLGAGNELLGFINVYPTPTGPAPVPIDIGTAATAETGFDAMTVLRWGRWAGGTATADLGGGQTDSIDLGNQSLHWVMGPEATVPPVMPITGQASYSLIGNTAPTDNLGNVGVLGSATFDADFTAMRVDSTLVIDINATTWTAAGTGNLGAAAGLPAHLFNGNYAVTVGGATGGSGVFSGFFSAPGNASDPSFPGGVGLTYSLQDMGATTTVSGAAVFGNP